MRRLFLLVVVLLDFCCGYEVLSPNTTNHTIMKAQVFTKPGCQSRCGDLLIPYPFGIKSEGGVDCAIDPSFELVCDASYNPPLAFSMIPYLRNLHIHDISDTELRISCVLAYHCFDQFGNPNETYIVQNGLDGTWFTYSTANVLTVVGCDDYANLYNDPSTFNFDPNNPNTFLPKGCSTTCLPDEEIPQDECSGTGCCQVPINVHKYFNIHIETYNSHRNVSSYNPCGYAFMAEKSGFKFQGKSDLNDPHLKDRIYNIPTVLDWAIGNKTCSEAALNQTSYACKFNNSYCINGSSSSNGYRCSCNEGFQGNPYLSPGCYDIDECAEKQKTNCDQICNNVVGSYYCSCRSGYYWNDDKCIAKKSQVIKFVLGIGFGCLWLLME